MADNMFTCEICGSEYEDSERHHDNVCMNCASTLVNDALSEDSQLF